MGQLDRKSEVTVKSDDNSSSSGDERNNNDQKGVTVNTTTTTPKQELTLDHDEYLAIATNVQGLTEKAPPAQIVWKNVIMFAYFHVLAVYGAYLMVTGNVMWKTLVFAWILHTWGGLGITAGAHRLWTHKAYKANFPLRFILTFFQTLAFQNSVWEWVRDHRVHHKYSETNADPHNARRGFFFAHVGWLLCRKHELVKVKGKTMDLSDIEKDPIVMFQKEYHLQLGLVVCFIMPAVVPWAMWNESIVTAFLVASVFRLGFTLHCTWLVNSAAHMWGPRPYDKSLNPAENRSVAILAMGEGWHNYHHVFPWDYKTAELGQYRWNLTTAFIDFFSLIGWAHDLKTVPKTVVQQRVKRTGDEAAYHHFHHPEQQVWGWGDKDIPAENLKVTQNLCPNPSKTD